MGWLSPLTTLWDYTVTIITFPYSVYTYYTTPFSPRYLALEYPNLPSRIAESSSEEMTEYIEVSEYTEVSEEESEDLETSFYRSGANLIKSELFISSI